MSPCPSGTIQEQIQCLERCIYDLMYSPSGVLAYTGAYTIDEYDDVWTRAMSVFNEDVDDLDELIVEASGLLRIVNNGLLFHRH